MDEYSTLHLTSESTHRMNASVNKAEKEDVHTSAVEEEKTNRLQEVSSDKTIKKSVTQEEKTTTTIPAPDTATFVLGGKAYHEVRTLSKSSGEAEVLLVERHDKMYVLKLYYPGYVPEEGVLQIVWNMDFEMIVRLYDYGKTIVNGISREYELQEWLEGISLADYTLGGDLKKFRRIALSAAASLAYCHNCNLIHKDVKLGNFIFRTKEAEELVLTDFGISTQMTDANSLHKTTQARTPMYAAPEMYDNVIDGVVEISPAADYYSLGIVLFFLWLGKNPFSGNERSMMRMKSEGKLPNLDQLPEEVRQLVRGLTVVNPEKRWRYDEVERWFKGEKVEIDETSIYLRYKSFVVDSEKNVLAANAQELAELLAVRRHLGIKYLYGKLISAWLEECGNQKLAVELDDIVDKRYPLNPEAGFQAALYTLDAKLPYRDNKGNVCNNIHEVVMTLLANMEDYKVLLQDENHPLYVYLEMTTELEVSRLKEHFRNDPPNVALWRMIYEVDDTVPFLLDKPSGTVDEIISAFADLNCREDEWQSLTDGRLLSWIYYKCDPLLYVELKEIYDKHLPYSRSLAYRVLYLMNRGIGFDLHDACERMQVAALMSNQLTKCQFCSEEEFREQMQEYIGPESRLAYYAEIKGWKDICIMQRRIFDLHATEHVTRYGVYDIRTAAYRFCMLLGCVPEYYLRTNGQLIDSLEQYQELDNKTKKVEMQQGCMKQWLTVFFHEDPFEPFEEKLSYEHALEEYLYEVGKADPEDPYYCRFKYAEETARKKQKSLQMVATLISVRERSMMVAFVAISALLCLLLMVFGYSNPARLMQMAPFSVGVPVGFFFMLLAVSWSYFHGHGFLAGTVLGGLGLGVGAIPVVVMRLVGETYPNWLVTVSIFMVLGGLLTGVLFGRAKSLYKYSELKPLFQKNSQSMLLDSLYYTFRQKNHRFKGSNYKALEDAVSVMNATKIEFMIHYVLWILMMSSLVILFVCFHESLLNWPTPDLHAFTNDILQFVKNL